MRILFDNILLDATFSAGEASANYPVTNLAHQFLRKRYQHTASSYDTVTITLDSATDIDCFFAGYSNSTQLVVRFYDALDALLLTETLVVDSGTNSFYKNQTYSVKKIEIDVYGASGTYLGGVGAGVCEVFPNPMSPWEEPFIDNSRVTSSDYGQTLNDQIEPIRRYAWMFRDSTRDGVNDLRDLYKLYPMGSRIWIDPFEDNHDYMEPFYGVVENTPFTPKNGRRFDMEWYFKEAR